MGANRTARWLGVVLAACTADTPAPVDDTDAPIDSTPVVIDEDEDGAPADVDCDDEDPTTFPGAPERCGDGVDQDCDPLTDCPLLCDPDAAMLASGCAALHLDLPAVAWAFGLDDEVTGHDDALTGLAALTGGAAGWVEGVVGGAVQFADGRFLELPDRPDADGFTLAAWVAVDVPPEDVEVDVFMELGNPIGAGAGVSVDQQLNLTAFGVDQARTRQYVGVKQATPLGCWQHVVLSGDGRRMAAWHDGRYVGEVPLVAPLLFGDPGVMIGGSPTSEGHAFKGRVDELWALGRAATDEDAATLFQAGLCGVTLRE